ncbi:MAG: AraC family transcriptional regulator [Ferruginibacter sp.]
MKNIPIRSINANQKEPDFSEPFSIRNVDDLLAGNDMVQELHRHDFFYMLALKKGAGHHEIDFTPYEVCGNAVFLMRRGQVHQLTLKAGSIGYLVQFATDFYHAHDKTFSQLLRKASNINFYKLDANSFKKTVAVLSYIFQEYTEKQEGYQDVIKSNLRILFIELTRQNTKGSNNVIPYMQEGLEGFLELMEQHIVSHKQVSQYAELLNLTAYQLNAITKATLGKTCSILINDYIILESKRYLLATSNQVNQIADQLGYEDVSYFIRFFKKQTGYSPESFRHKFR